MAERDEQPERAGPSTANGREVAPAATGAPSLANQAHVTEAQGLSGHVSATSGGEPMARGCDPLEVKACDAPDGKLSCDMLEAKAPCDVADPSTACLEAKSACERSESKLTGECLLTTGDMARLGNTTLRTVRFYEEEGLISPAARSEGGHRMFPKTELLKLQLISDLRECGLPLNDIKELFALKARFPTPEAASGRMAELLEQQIDAMQKKILVMRRLREELASTIAVIRECHGCTEPAFPRECGKCDVLCRTDLPRAMRLLWST